MNFAAQSSATPSGYSNDYGVAWSDDAGQGWENAADGTPVSLVGNGRERNLAASPDKRYDTMIQMQQSAASSGGTQTPGQWEHALTNGDYLVTVAAGDASATNSIDRITLEPGTPNAVTIINNFVPSTDNYFATATQRVTVSDGRLTLNATGGTNTKIDFIDAVPAAPDTTAPVTAINLAGYVISAGVYGSAVTATVTAADEAGGSGVASVTYSLDGGAAKPLHRPIKVTALGNHTLTVNAQDKAGNLATATSHLVAAAADLPQLRGQLGRQRHAAPGGTAAGVLRGPRLRPGAAALLHLRQHRHPAAHGDRPALHRRRRHELRAGRRPGLVADDRGRRLVAGRGALPPDRPDRLPGHRGARTPSATSTGTRRWSTRPTTR